MKLEKKMRRNNVGLTILIGVIIAIMIMVLTYNVVLPLIITTNPNYFDSYQRLFPEPMIPLLSMIILGVFLYHITRFALANVKSK
ncbi:MAG: hypothetical protein KGZ38_03665 [Erysipelothrix sp.]|jgi:uncharacterized membrane protein|nr:hypothetical protein [Erysipelothrix sp.]